MMKKINWAVIGTAEIAKTKVIPGMVLANNCNLYAIAGRKSEKIAEFQKLFGFEKAYLNYDEVLHDPLVDAVYIPLSNDLHKEWVIKAARAKKHILCEKPLVKTASEVQELIDICQAEGVFLMEAFAYLHSPIINDLLDRVHDGVIGKIGAIETKFHIPKQSPEDIRSRKETLGGAQYDVGCYNVSLILKLMKQMPINVVAHGKMTETGVDEFCHATLKFNDGVIATSACSMLLDPTPPYRIDECYIHGDLGTIEFMIPYNESGELSYKIKKAGETEEIKMHVPNNYQLEIEQFGRCVVGLETPRVTNEFSYKVSQVQDEIFAAIGY